MKVVVFGSRCYDPARYKSIAPFMDLIEASIKGMGIQVSEATILSGKARGADQMGELFADLHNLTVEEYPADWENLGKRAGMVRNAEMAKDCDFGVCFWDGKSPGTRNMLEETDGYNKYVYVFRPAPPPPPAVVPLALAAEGGKC